MALPMKLLFAGIATGLFVWGILDCITNFEQNDCEMTWMYEYPQYLNVPLAVSLRRQYPWYSLHVYGEGNYAQTISNMKFSGIPVLFIPGNAGSYKQVRSLGSVSLRMSEKPGIKFHFNYFVVNFDEEFSALYGAVLQKQTEFVHACVKKILSLYKSSKTPPTSVILVGHSMGGVVARALFTMPDFDPKSVHIIITQASPHQAPVVAVDSAIEQFYHQVNEYWYHNSNSSLAHVTAVSTGGGYRDFQVRSGLASFSTLLPESRSVSTNTMSVPLAWVSTDHLCSVWCRQMVLTTVRALFDVVDKQTLQPTTDVSQKMRAFQHHFLNNNGFEMTAEGNSKYMKLDSKIPWEVRRDKVWRLQEKKVSKSHYIAFPVTYTDGEGEKEHVTDSITIISNITDRHWVCACRIEEGQDRCSDCLSLLADVRLLPPRNSHRKVLRMAVEDLGDNTHIVLFVPAGTNSLEIMVDKYHIDNRHLLYELPSLYDTIISFPISVSDGTAMLQISNQSVFYSLHIAGLSGPLTAYTAVVSSLRCSSQIEPGLYEGSVMTLHVPWSSENTYQFFRYGGKGTLPIKLQAPRHSSVEDRFGFEHQEAHLEMYLHPACHYQLRLLMAPGQSLGQFVRFYGTLMPVMFVAVLLLTLGGQLTAFATDGECMWVGDAIFAYSRPFYMVPVAVIIHTISNMKPILKVLRQVGVPPDDMDELVARDLWIQVLPVMLCLLAWLITILHCYLAHYALAALTHAVAFLFRWVPDKVFSLGVVLQTALCIAAFLSSAGLCGTLGICIVYVLLLFKTMQLYYLSVKHGGKVEKSKLSFYFLLVFIYMWLIIINAPSALVWAKGLRYSFHLSVDPSRLAGMVATVSATCTLFSDSPQRERSFAFLLRRTIYTITVMSMPYCLIRMYRLNIVISIVLSLLALARIPALASRFTQKQRIKNE